MDTLDRERQIDELIRKVSRLERRAEARKRLLLGTLTAVAGLSAVLFARRALSDPSTAAPCAHGSLYCFQKDTPAVAAQVNSNFETVYAAVDNTSSKVDAVTNKVNPLSNNISVDGSGNLTVLHDLKVSGRLHGFKLTPEYTAYRYPGPGTTTTQMIAAATGYCFLTQAYHHGSFESCYVDINSGYWEVHASALGTGEEASCGARCIIGPLD